MEEDTLMFTDASKLILSQDALLDIIEEYMNSRLFCNHYVEVVSCGVYKDGKVEVVFKPKPEKEKK